ncbi:MAG: SIMPL domain-containing protein [Hyphomonadaceae bacterium]|nr:SIMPL domain-containing protein [Hyphomonadaceae bacterium]
MTRPLAAAAAFAALAAAAPAAAQDHAAHAARPAEGAMLTITAEGRVTSRPDLAIVSLGVVTEGATAAAALQSNARAMTQAVAALRRAGVAERDIQTTQVSVNPQYAYQEGAQPRLTGYQANNAVSAKIRNLDALGRTLDAAVAAGGNQVQGVTFTLANPDPVLDQARQAAVRNARARAALYAEAAGLTVDRIVAISEGGGGYPAPPPPPPMMMARMAEAMPTPTAPGELETVASVTVMFALK